MIQLVFMSTGEMEDIVFEPGHQRVEHVDEEPSHALFAAWQNSSVNQANAREDREFQRTVLRDVVESAAQSQGDPARRNIIQTYGDITAYFWFGNDHTPLPRGLKRYLLPDEDTPMLTLDYDHADHQDMHNVAAMLGPLGLGELLAYRRELFNEQSPHLFEPLVEALVSNTPGYRLLESFNLDRYTWNERPLTPVERLLEEQAAEESVRRRHGVPAGQDLRTHSAARADLTRAVLRLDETTRYDRHALPETDSPATRAIKFFKGLAADELGSSVRGTEIHSIKTVTYGMPADPPPTGDRRPLLPQKEPGAYNVIRIVTDAETVNHSTESFVTWAQSMDYLSSPGQARLRGISTFLVTDALTTLLDEDGADINYSELLEELLARYTGSLTESYRDFVSANIASRQFGTLATLLAMPSEFYEELDSFILAYDKRQGFEPLRALSRREYKRGMRETLGSIKKRPVDDTSQRIIQYHDADPELGGFDEDEADLILKLKAISDGLFPTIPGYQPLGLDTERKLFALRYTPEADPYTECATIIPDQARLALAQTYADVGLHELAMLVHGTPDMTVSQLTRDISRTNRYILPRDAFMPKFPANLADYAGQIGADGRLHMQCVGSSHFLYLSLKEVFGGEAVSIINGDTLPSLGRRLPRVGHQQTPFTDPETNQLYILDATSRGVSTIEVRNAVSGYTDALRRLVGLHVLKQLIRPRTAPAAPERPHFESTEARTVASPEAHRQVLLEQNRDTLIMQLRMVYGTDGRPMRHDDLMEQTAKLHTDDIVFRTLSTAILAAGGQAEPEDPSRIMRYIQALQDCDDRALLRKVDPFEYTRQPRLLHALEKALAEIARLSR
jgi:hypothetical protein